ncbi:hypothetical protein CONPUDRAFT_116479 [Coniophora puteana RWD-64-598 SS2]|uniref:Methyltransferase domain-containing protein n=1 Tax=Coniophora puteana (strain RWD-64-598) TaxID=741705 RepID=A0A5M3N863_CONPW|nr:uncharacterized protein CONPUDRAFT_116479 [Coniophora puteana RWD-64-598 SS2]EIW87294.1 hypothetical protein CONPUDRAFT_116479 [Coniophora puteana RWD-64-598 SS2]
MPSQALQTQTDSDASRHAIVASQGQLGLHNIPPPDDDRYQIGDEEAAFYKAQTGIHDDRELKEHIIRVQRKAYKVAPYTCVLVFAFLQFSVHKHPAYDKLVRIGNERKDAILLDIGGFFGQEARKAAADAAYKPENIVVQDLFDGFFPLGHELFRTTPSTFPAHFVAGDAFDAKVLDIFPPAELGQAPPRHAMTNLESLNPLRGQFSVIYAAKFFHLFNEEKQLHLARALAGLLSPEHGSMILGSHAGGKEKGLLTTERAGTRVSLFCHCPESWVAMWESDVFKTGQVKAEAWLKDMEYNGEMYCFLEWSVVRL